MADPNGDGYTNLDEFNSGSNPLDSASVPGAPAGPSYQIGFGRTSQAGAGGHYFYFGPSGQLSAIDGQPAAGGIPSWGNMADPNGDGYTNLDEFNSGSNPLDSASVPGAPAGPSYQIGFGRTSQAGAGDDYFYFGPSGQLSAIRAQPAACGVRSWGNV